MDLVERHGNEDGSRAETGVSDMMPALVGATDFREISQYFVDGGLEVLVDDEVVELVVVRHLFA